MRVKYLKKFSKDLDSITDQKMLDRIKKRIIEIESASSKKEVKGLKKLKANPTAYRIRIGQYRMGVYIQDETIEIARIVHRKDIYDVFP